MPTWKGAAPGTISPPGEAGRDTIPLPSRPGEAARETIPLASRPGEAERETLVPDLVGYAKRVVLCMTDNPWFPSPIPSIADVASAVDELESAQVATLTRTRGTAEVRDARLKVVNGLLKRLKAYVQGVADDNPEQAGSIIESSGMNIKNKGSYAKPPFKVKPGRVKGTVRLEVRSAGDRASYEWGWSTDGGKTWQTRRTTQASVDIDGLPSGTLCLFRCQVTTPKGGNGNWSETVELLVP